MIGGHRYGDEHSPQENNEDRDRHPQTLHDWVILARRPPASFWAQRAWTVRTRSIEPNISLVEGVDASWNMYSVQP